MVEYQHQYVERVDPACVAAVAVLENDPFYRSICASYERDAARRRAVLEQYFAYSIQEGRDLGRCVHLADPTRGVAVWLLPQAPDVQSRAAKNKRAFLEATLDAEGTANYHRIINFIRTRAGSLVSDRAWYLSIVAVDPTAQGQGLGRKLREPTIADADRVFRDLLPGNLQPSKPRFLRAPRLCYSGAIRGANDGLGLRRDGSPSRRGNRGRRALGGCGKTRDSYQATPSGVP